MDITIDQQVALDEALVPHASLLRIGKSKFRLRFDLKSKESTLQVVYDVLKLTPFYKAFLVTADVPAIYMQEFWATTTVHHHSIRFKMNNKKHIDNLEYFREMLQICLRFPNQPFDELPFEKEILAFLRELSHSGEIKMITDEDFVYQIEHKDAKKSNDMYYPRFTKVIVNFFMTKEQSIPRRNKVNWHFVRDDHLFTMIKLVSKHQNTQQYVAILPIKLTNEAIRNLESYKEYYATASGAAPPKTKASIRKKQSSSDTTMPPPTTKGKRLKTSAKVDKYAKEKQPAKSSKAKGTDEGTGIILGVPDVPIYESDDEEISWKSSEEDDDDDEVKISRHDEDVDEQKDKEEESFDPIVQTPSHVKNTDDEDNDDDSHGMNVEGDKGANEEDDDNDLYEDVHINLEGRNIQMSDVQTTQVIEDTHVTLTLVNPEGQQHSSFVSSHFVSNMLNPSSDTSIESIFESTPRVDVPVTTTDEPPLLSATTLPLPSISIIPHVQQTPAPSLANVLSSSLQDLPNFRSLFRFDHILKALETSFSEVMQTNQFVEAISSILGIVDKYLEHRMNEAVKKIIKEQVKEQVKVQVSKILPKIEKTVNEQLEAEVLTRSSKTSHAVATDLSELELKKILINKMKSNKSIHKLDEQKNLYKALVDAYECDKLILDTYGDTVALKRHRDDEDKEEEPSAGSNLGSKRRRAGKEPESTSAPKEKTSKTTGKSTEGNLAKKADSYTLFNELMDTPVDFLAFMMNRLKVDTLTPELLAGPTYELMKGSYNSLVELEFFLEEVYKATTSQLDWNNPEGQQYTHDLLKPLLLIPNSQGRRVIPFDHFINNDLEYLRGGVSSQKYTTLVTKTKATDYGHIKWIEDLVPRTIDDDKLYKFKERDFKRLRIQDIKDMLLLLLQGKLTNLTVDERFAFNVSLRIWKSLIRFKRKEAYTAYSNPRGFIYQNKDKQNKLMRIDELHKFSDDTLNDVQTTLDDHLKGIQMQYLPQTIWRRSDKDRAVVMIQAIDKQLKTRRIMRSLEKFIGERLYEGDLRMLQRTI
nr:hypothetical protein [Tanacetum cinerariifolium]